MLPFSPTAAQQEALAALGYLRREVRPERWSYDHPDGLGAALLSHDLGAAFDQQVLWAFLRAAPVEVQSRYRWTYLAAGRDAADAELLPPARAAHVAQTRFGPLERAAALVEPLGLPWMFAAGWALDLHRHLHGQGPSRPHEDVDIVLPREGQLAVGGTLVAAGYRVSAVRDGAYFDWDVSLPPPHFQLHAHRGEGEMLDLMLTDLSGGLWRYRRDPQVTLPIGEARRVSSQGLPYLAPEVALLFKAGRTGDTAFTVRPEDQLDFEAVLPHLDDGARAWLAARLPDGHAWKSQLGG